MGGIAKSVTGALGMGKVPKPKAMAGAQFQPFGYTSLAGTATGEKEGQGFKFSQELSPELQSLYGAGLAQAQPFLSQYLQQAQAPVAGFDFGADPRAREAEIFQQQAGLLQPELLRQQTQARDVMFGSGRLGLQLAGDTTGAGGMVNPDAYNLNLAQSRAIAELAPQARQMAQAEQQQAFDQAQQAYSLNQMAQQQQLQNLLAGYQGAFGTAQNVLGMEQGLIGQAAGLEEARARAMAGSATAGAALTPQQSGGGLFGGMLGAAAGSFGGPFGSAMAGKLLGSGGTP